MSVDWTCDRRFQVWAYGVSSQRLLLRSNKWNVHSTRIEVMFQGVQWLQLATWYESLRIIEDGNDFSELPSQAFHSSFRLYRLRGPEAQEGVIVAATVIKGETDLEYDEPSTLWDHEVGLRP